MKETCLVNVRHSQTIKVMKRLVKRNNTHNNALSLPSSEEIEPFSTFLLNNLRVFISRHGVYYVSEAILIYAVSSRKKSDTLQFL